MVSCLILYHRTISSLTKIKMLRFIFKDEQFEINVVENNTVIVYVWNVDKKMMYQAALDFEFAHITAGYGFGMLKREAEKKAKERLQWHLYSSTISPIIHEEVCSYQCYKITS